MATRNFGASAASDLVVSPLGASVSAMDDVDRQSVDNVVPLRPRTPAHPRQTERLTGQTERQNRQTERLRVVIGEVLREERHRQQRTLVDVADRAAVSVPYLSEVERGRKEVSSDVLDAVVRALDVELADVLERSARRLRPEGKRRTTMRLLAA